MTDAQREYLLRQQLKAIQPELGEGQSVTSRSCASGLEAAALPEAVAKTLAEREFDRLARMSSASPEYQMVSTYLDWVLDMPWTRRPRTDSTRSRRARVLDEDHYGLEKVKERILEYLAVRKLKGDIKGPILCFVGPPGVGKTSLGQSIARAMGAQVRAHLARRRARRGRDPRAPAHLYRRHARPHHPGPQAGRDDNPVFMLDEIDKLALGFRGDPAAALLEVLDPEQNHSFNDHYLESLSTSRRSSSSPPPTCSTPSPAAARPHGDDRAAGYTEHEKLTSRSATWCRGSSTRTACPTATDHQRRRAMHIIEDYTREAGVRSLERQIGASPARSARRARWRAAAAEDRTRSAPTTSRLPRPAAVQSDDRLRAAAARRRHRHRLDPDRRRRALHRGRLLPGGQAAT